MNSLYTQSKWRSYLQGTLNVISNIIDHHLTSNEGHIRNWASSCKQKATKANTNIYIYLYFSDNEDGEACFFERTYIHKLLTK